jgi:hypothetical protein
VAEARELRAGGPVVVAQAVGVAADTVRQGRGRAELDDPVLPPVGVVLSSCWVSSVTRVSLGARGGP